MHGWYGDEKPLPTIESPLVNLVWLCLSFCPSRSKLFSSHVKNLNEGPQNRRRASQNAKGCQSPWCRVTGLLARSHPIWFQQLQTSNCRHLNFAKGVVGSCTDVLNEFKSSKKMGRCWHNGITNWSLYRQKINFQRNLMKSQMKLVVRTIAKKEWGMAPFQCIWMSNCWRNWSILDVD